jgi:hypothetical protein
VVQTSQRSNFEAITVAEANLLGSRGLLRRLLTFTLVDGVLVTFAVFPKADVLPYLLCRTTVGGESGASLPNIVVVELSSQGMVHFRFGV